MGIEADAAARVAFDHRLPDLERLVVLADLEADVAGLEQFARGAVLDDRSALGGGFFLVLRSLSKEGSWQEEEQRERKVAE